MEAPASWALHLVVVEPAHILRRQDSLACLELSYTGHLEDRDGETLLEVDQAVFLGVDVEVPLLRLDTVHVADWVVHTQQGAAGSLLLWWWM